MIKKPGKTFPQKYAENCVHTTKYTKNVTYRIIFEIRYTFDPE